MKKKKESLGRSSEGSCDTQLLRLNITSVFNYGTLYLLSFPQNPLKFHFPPLGTVAHQLCLFTHLASVNYASVFLQRTNRIISVCPQHTNVSNAVPVVRVAVMNKYNYAQLLSAAAARTGAEVLN